MGSVLVEMKYALEVLDAVFTSSAYEKEKIAIFSDIIKRQGKDNWKALLKQYEELSSEIYKHPKTDFFKLVRNHIKEHS